VQVEPEAAAVEEVVRLLRSQEHQTPAAAVAVDDLLTAAAKVVVRV
jgi:hypothetical protein